MYGGSGKQRRGGGGSAGKRNIHALPINRAAHTSRPSLGGGPRGRAGASSSGISSPPTSSLLAEESFSLVRENPLNFGMAIKLAPDLVEEIKRVEAQGGTARIKFDANANNPNGNVIHVGNKKFRFTWSREPGDHCDIYEEHQTGEDGNGLLVESGATWRKLNVERELDESTKNHVKRRSEEAERKSKARKAIVLDHQNPSTKNQMKALAAAESNPFRSFKHKKEPPFKKLKSEPPSGGPPKSVYKSGLSAPTLSKGSRRSPLPSQLEQRGASASPFGSGNRMEERASIPDVAPAQNIIKGAISEKEMHARLPSGIVREKSTANRNAEAKPVDLKSLIISLLLEHQSKGMSLKALEKAIGDAMPNSIRQIEPILKQIATFQAPGRYFLKTGVDMERFKKPPSQTGRSPEANHHQSPERPKSDLPAQDPSFSMRTATNHEEQGEPNSTPEHNIDALEKIDILHGPPENFSDKKVSDNSEGLAGSSSDSGSDSQSDSDSDSGSDSGSHSRSKSRSPVGSQSVSSSDSESDASSSSKQASDEDVDIMTSDDEKESKHKLLDSELSSLKSPVQWSNPDNESIDIGNYEKHDDHVSDVVEIEKDSPQDDHQSERAAAFPNKQDEEPIEVIKHSSAGHNEYQERQVVERKSHDGPGSVVFDAFNHVQSGSHERYSKGKSKRRIDDQLSDERNHNRKRSKGKSSSQPIAGTLSSLFGESPDNSSPDRPLQSSDEGPINVMVNRPRDDMHDPVLQTDSNQINPLRIAYDSQQLDQRVCDASGRAEPPSAEKRPGRHENRDHGIKHTENSLLTSEGFEVQKGFNTESQSEDGSVTQGRPTKLSAEVVGDKRPIIIESHYKKPEMPGKVKEAGTDSNSYPGHSPKDNSAIAKDISLVMNGQSSVLRRMHSELELGEFREPFNDDTSGSQKQLEKNNSFKQLENKWIVSENQDFDLSRGKKTSKSSADAKFSSPNSAAVVSAIPGEPTKRKAMQHHADDLARPNDRSARSVNQHRQSCADHASLGSEHNTVPEMSDKSRYSEAVAGQGASLEAYGNTAKKKRGDSTEQQCEPRRGLGPYTMKEGKKQNPNVVGESNDRRKDASVATGNDGNKKGREPSSDENSCSYTKYEKEKPELKGPITNASQYKEYVEEYQEKYASYCSLNKILESYRDEFSKLGKDLEVYRGRDIKRYHDVLEQMRSSFRQCGERHKRLKKIFVVLYEELKHLKQMIKDYAALHKRD